MLNQEIQAKERLVKQGDIPEIRELAKFIQYLDEKYGVDSSDTKNTFGIVNLDRMLVSELYPSNLYFSLGGYSSDPKHLPKHGVNRSNSDVIVFRTSTHRMIPSIDLAVEEADVERLFDLRAKAIAAAKAAYPRLPQFPEDVTSVKDYDRILEEQGFASGKRSFSWEKYISGPTASSSGRFEVSYGRCGANRSPDFSTTFKGFQNQEDMPHTHPAYRFYRKWNPFHIRPMTIQEYMEMWEDLKEMEQLAKEWKVNGNL